MKLILLRNKHGDFPSVWQPLYHSKINSKERFWLGGSATVVLAKDSKIAKKIIRKARKELARFELEFRTETCTVLSK